MGRRLRPQTEARRNVQRKNYQENIVTPYFVSTGVGLLVSQGKEKVTTAWALRFLFPVGAFKKKITNFYVYGIWVFCLLVCMYHVCAILVETRRVLDSVELQLTGVSHHVNRSQGKQTHFLSKSNKC